MQTSIDSPDVWPGWISSDDGKQWNDYVSKYHPETLMPEYDVCESRIYREKFYNDLKDGCGRIKENPPIPDQYRSSLLGGLISYLFDETHGKGIILEQFNPLYRKALRHYVERARGIHHDDIDDIEFFKKNPWKNLSDDRSKSSFIKELTTTILDNSSELPELEDMKDASLDLYHLFVHKNPQDDMSAAFDRQRCANDMKNDMSKYRNSAILAIEEHLSRNYPDIDSLEESDITAIRRIATLYGGLSYDRNGDKKNFAVVSPVILDVFKKADVLTDANYLKKKYKSQPL